MQQDNYDSSTSGYIVDSFEGISREFTDVEILSTSEVNIVAKGKRYGRWWLLKGEGEQSDGEREALRQRLRKELEILMLLQHPHVVTPVGLEEVESLGVCIVMEYVDGTTLKEWLLGKHSLKERRRVADELTNAIGYIHSKGIVHRDLKPENIMVTRNGENVKLIDFGLADTDSHAVLKQPAGTLQYMSPEQQQTAVADVRNDIYSLGVIFQQMDLGYGSIIKKCLLPISQRYQHVAALRNDMAKRNKRGWRIVVWSIIAAFVVLLLSVVGLAVRQKMLNQTIDSQYQTIDTQQKEIRSQQAAIKNQHAELGDLRQHAQENRQELETQKGNIQVLENDKVVQQEQEREQQRQKELQRENERRKQQYVACWMAGSDSLNKAVNTAGSPNERYERGMRAIQKFMSSETANLNADEKQRLERNLKAILNSLIER